MDGSVVVCGRAFTHTVVARINAAVRDHPEWSRADLARSVCDWLDWRAANGKRKEINCRVALVRLESRGVIDLPPPRRKVRFAGQSFTATGLNVPQSLECSVSEIGKLKLVLVTSKDRELDLQWKKLVATHHYLGYRPLCGAQLRSDRLRARVCGSAGLQRGRLAVEGPRVLDRLESAGASGTSALCGGQLALCDCAPGSGS